MSELCVILKWYFSAFSTSPRERWRAEYHRAHLGLHCKEAVRIISILCLGMTQPALRAIRGAEPPRAGFHASTLLCIDIIPTVSKQLRISSSDGTLSAIAPLHCGNVVNYKRVLKSEVCEIFIISYAYANDRPAADTHAHSRGYNSLRSLYLVTHKNWF